jgi:hypothetical protein
MHHKASSTGIKTLFVLSNKRSDGISYREDQQLALAANPNTNLGKKDTAMLKIFRAQHKAAGPRKDGVTQCLLSYPQEDGQPKGPSLASLLAS